MTIFKRWEDPLTSVQRFAIGEGSGPLLDWQRVEEIIRRKDGVALEVSRKPLRTGD